MGNPNIWMEAQKAGKQFKPGQSGNPNGRPKSGVARVNAELAERGISPATKHDITGAYLSIMNAPEEELKNLMNDKARPMLVRIVAKQILSGKGFDVIEKMLDRSIGRPTQYVEEKSTVTLAPLTDDEQAFIDSVTDDADE